MPNTTWNPSDKTASIALTNFNLTATASAGNQGVRATDRQVSGKFYWEYTCTIVVGCGLGFLSSFTALTNGIGASSGPFSCGCGSAGGIFVGGTSTGSSIGTISNGNVVCIAVDFTARLAWFRLGAAGNWNGSATANPATGAGGISHTLGNGVPAHPAITGINTTAITANFGDTAFVGAVPAGFTSGFTAGATSSTNALATQTAAEEWITTDPPAQITQVAIEEWTSVQNAPPNVYTGVLSGSRAGIGSAVVSSTAALITPNLVGIGVVGLPLAILPAARVTQVALEEWAAVAPAVPVEAWVTQVALEEWASIGPTFEYAEAGGLARENLVSVLAADARVYAAGLARETLLTMVPGQSQVRVGALVREALVSGVIVPRQYAVPVS